MGVTAVKILRMSNPGGSTAAGEPATAEARADRLRAVLAKLAAVLGTALTRLRRRPEKRLRLCENLALGDRRFVAVVQYQQTRFLLGGTASSLVLLARLGDIAEDSLGTRGDRPTQAGTDGTTGSKDQSC
jgi:flagellar biogenesis protein FliO